jgi:GDPmannose 4,6-dehydratase
MAGRSALVTGITGQDGSYLAELLLAKGYSVTGLVHRPTTPSEENLAGIADRLQLLDGDLLDQGSLDRAVRTADPDEVYNMGAQTFVGTSFAEPVRTGEVTGLGVLRLLEAVRTHAPQARVYQAASSEMFGHVATEPQDEQTPFHPGNPYAVAKVYAHWACVNYRETYSMFISNGIFFNHESPRRGREFVTRKITEGVARIAAGKSDHIDLGNLDARRDWGYAPDYVDLAWRMLQADSPGDFVGATGVSHSVREFAEAAFRAAGISDWEHHLRSDPSLQRPADPHHLRGNAAKARRDLGWSTSVGFDELVRIMVRADVARARGEPP